MAHLRMRIYVQIQVLQSFGEAADVISRGKGGSVVLRFMWWWSEKKTKVDVGEKDGGGGQLDPHCPRLEATPVGFC